MDEIPRKDCEMVFLVFEGGPLHCPKNPKNDEIIWMYHESKISEGTLIFNNIDY